VTDELWRRLELGLTAGEMASVKRLLRGRSLPFGRRLHEALDLLLLEVSDEQLELLMKCASLLEPEAAALPDDAAPSVSHHVFTFTPDQPELPHFLGSLRQNGYAVSVVEGAEVAVHVYVEAATEAEAFQQRMLLHTLFDLTRTVRGRNPKGRRVY
jgi:hypothetical protein